MNKITFVYVLLFRPSLRVHSGKPLNLEPPLLGPTLVRFSRLRRFWESVSSIVPREVTIQFAFFIGLLVGGILSIVAYILLFSAFLFGALQALVAAGTLSLAGVTSYITIRDRREALRRELADRVYVPMRKKALSWLDPESPPYSLPTWTQLSENIPYLTRNVSSNLKKLLAKGETIERETFTYSTPTTLLIQEFSKESTSGTNVRIVVRQSSKEEQYLGEVYSINIWKSGKTLEQYITDFVSSRYPLVKGWNLELLADLPAPGGGTVGQKIGGNDETRGYIAELIKFLNSQPHAVTYRVKYEELSKVGAEAFREIEKELRKPVAPMISSPAKEPGNPWG